MSDPVDIPTSGAEQSEVVPPPSVGESHEVHEQHVVVPPVSTPVDELHDVVNSSNFGRADSMAANEASQRPNALAAQPLPYGVRLSEASWASYDVWSEKYWATRSRDDLAEYREHYPRAVNDPSQKRNLQFFRNEIVMVPDHLCLEDALTKWRGDYDMLESGHSYIQWLFPIQEHGLNPSAQPLMKHEAESMQKDAVVMNRVHRTFDFMLDFYGFQRQDDVIQRAAHYQKAFYNLNNSPHNNLRITRMLKFLGELGLEVLKVAWLRALAEEVFGSKLLDKCRKSLEDYWVGTIYDDEVRADFKEKIKGIVARPEVQQAGNNVYGRSHYGGWYSNFGFGFQHSQHKGHSKW